MFTVFKLLPHLYEKIAFELRDYGRLNNNYIVSSIVLRTPIRGIWLFHRRSLRPHGSNNRRKDRTLAGGTNTDLNLPLTFLSSWGSRACLVGGWPRWSSYTLPPGQITYNVYAVIREQEVARAQLLRSVSLVSFLQAMSCYNKFMPVILASSKAKSGCKGVNLWP